MIVTNDLGMDAWVQAYGLENDNFVLKGLQWAVLNRSEQTDPLHSLPTDFESWMGNLITPCNLSELIGCRIIHVEWIYILEWNTRVMAKCRICGSILEVCSECGRKVCTGGCHKECGEEYGTYDPEYSKWYSRN